MAKLNTQIVELLTCSVEQYGELQKHTKMLVQLLAKSDYSKVGEHAVELKNMQDEAQKDDERLLPLLTEEPGVWEEHPLFVQRKKHIRSILEMNSGLSPQIQSAIAVTAAEIRELSGGRTVVAGYASQVTGNKSSLGVVG